MGAPIVYDLQQKIFSISWNHLETFSSPVLSSTSGFRACIAVGSRLLQRDNNIIAVEVDSRKPVDLSFKQITTREHPLPITRLKWSYSHLVKDPSSRILAACGSDIHLYKHDSNGDLQKIHHLNNILPGKKSESGSAPVTSLDWNFADPKILATCSIDTTCTIWNVETGQPKTQLIAHDKQVYDISFSNAPDIFASVGGDGSVRLFDLRNLEHSTILYENNSFGSQSANSSSLLRILWNKLDNHFLVTFQENSSKIVLLDNRLPSVPVAELIGHNEGSSLVDICWSPTSSGHLASLANDGEILIWDLLNPDLCRASTVSSKASSSSFTSLAPTNGPSLLSSCPPTTGAVKPAFGYSIPSKFGCQLVWPMESENVIVASDDTRVHVIPI